MKKSPLKRKTPLGAKTVSSRRKPISQASEEQRAKVREIGHCQACGRSAHHYLYIDAAHVIDRSLGGCDDALCVVALCREPGGKGCHREYDEHRLEVLSLLSKEEQAHAVLHVGIESARTRTAPGEYER